MKVVKDSLTAIIPALVVVALTAVIAAASASLLSSLSERTYTEQMARHQTCIEERKTAFFIATANGTLALADALEGRQPPPAFRAEMQVAKDGLARIHTECPPIPRPFP